MSKISCSYISTRVHTQTGGSYGISFKEYLTSSGPTCKKGNPCYFLFPSMVFSRKTHFDKDWLHEGALMYNGKLYGAIKEYCRQWKMKIVYK